MSDPFVDIYLINRRKQYPGSFRETLIRGLQLPLTADYKTQHVSDVRASRAMARSREFVATIRAKVGET